MTEPVKVNLEPVTGSSYERASQFVFNNPRQGTPNVTIFQEKLTELQSGSVFAQQMKSLNADFNNSGQLIQIYDPITGSDTGQTITAGEIHAMLYSLWRSLKGDN